MMRLSTKGRYGARLMLDLALHYGKGPVLLKNIAKSEEISRSYLDQIVPLLRAAKLINSGRGAHGGYTLARAPSEITLKEVIESLEGSLSPVECIDTPSVCQRNQLCVTRDIWKKLGEKMSGVLETLTLQDMVEEKRIREKLLPM